jgi:toxin-antitoxin system PIN domain toxin
VILCDANVLIYAFRKDTDRHDEYRQWLEKTMTTEPAFGYCESVLASVIRITTHPKIFNKPGTLEEAFTFTDFIKNCHNSVLVVPGPRHWSIFRSLCHSASARGNLITDAYLAALAIESGAEWITTDRDFAGFPRLKWRHPID